MLLMNVAPRRSQCCTAFEDTPIARTFAAAASVARDRKRERTDRCLTSADSPQPVLAEPRQKLRPEFAGLHS